MPDMETPDITGEKIYEMHLKNIQKQLNKVLMEKSMVGGGVRDVDIQKERTESHYQSG